MGRRRSNRCSSLWLPFAYNRLKAYRSLAKTVLRRTFLHLYRGDPGHLWNHHLNVGFPSSPLDYSLVGVEDCNVRNEMPSIINKSTLRQGLRQYDTARHRIIAGKDTTRLLQTDSEKCPNHISQEEKETALPIRLSTAIGEEYY